MHCVSDGRGMLLIYISFKTKNKFSLIINVKRPADGMQKKKAYNVVAMNEEVLMIYSFVATNVFPRFSSFVATIY